VTDPGIVRFFGICFDEENTAYLVLEYCPSTVANILHDEKCDREKSTLCYELMETLQILIDVANTMRFLHSAGVVHRDLKPENLLIDQNQNVRICDFGLARHVRSRTRTIRVSKGIGTPAFMAPEILDPDDTSPVDGSKTDVFAFGIVMWSLLFRTKPYYNIPTNLDIVEGVLHRNMRPELPFSESELLGAKFLKRPTSAPSSPMDVQRPMRRISTKPARFFGMSLFYVYVCVPSLFVTRTHTNKQTNTQRLRRRRLRFSKTRVRDEIYEHVSCLGYS
jgi:serine/threonine protein kinase